MNADPICVLIVENNVTLRDELAHFLGEKNYIVIRTSSPRLALETLYSDPVPRWILLCGQALSETSGAELIVNALLAQSNLMGALILSELPAVEIWKHKKTALAEQTCAKAGVFFEILEKPLNVESLLAKLARITSGVLAH
jgi:DNA-binding response OmpR family regulator